MRMIYGVEAGDVYWAASDVGWVVGHSYIVYAPLLRGCTSVMYEGKPVGTPDAGAFWRVIAQHGVKVLFTAPTAMRAIKQQDPEGKLLRTLRPVASSRRCSSPASAAIRRPPIWARDVARQAGGRSLVADRDRLGDHRRLPRVRAVPVQARLRRAALSRATTCTRWTMTGTCCRAAQTGNLCVRLPLPPGCAPDAVAERRGLSQRLPGRLPRLVSHRRCRRDRRGWRRLGDGPHRRHHQCRRPPVVHRTDGGGAGLARRTSPNARWSVRRTN